MNFSGNFIPVKSLIIRLIKCKIFVHTNQIKRAGYPKTNLVYN